MSSRPLAKAITAGRVSDDDYLDERIPFLTINAGIFDSIKKVDKGWYGFWDH
jgi:hypothetical protein